MAQWSVDGVETGVNGGAEEVEVRHMTYTHRGAISCSNLVISRIAIQLLH